MKRFLLVLALATFSNLFASEFYTIQFTQPQNTTYQLNLNVRQYQISEKEINGVMYSILEFGSAVRTQQKGFAALPILSASVKLPPQKDVDFEWATDAFEDIPLKYPLLPSRGVIYRTQDPSQIPYEIDPASQTDNWYPGFAAKSNRPFIVRDVRGERVQFFPFQYNGEKQILRVIKSITVRLTENDNPPTNPLTHRAGHPMPETNALYGSLFINSVDAASDLHMLQHGDVLVITTSRDESAIEPYIQWKREKGFKVNKEVVSSGTLVKSLIQQKYDENPNLLYVQLVGDWEDIKSELGTSSNLPMDPDMGCVSGDDDFQDIAIGRLSGHSADDITIQVNKILSYEKTPETATNWFPTATAIASDQGPGDDNEYDYEHENVIWNDKLDPFTYDSFNSIYDPSATKTDVSNAVNNGTGIINYTGHGSSTSWGTTGFSNSDVQNLTNGDMLPFIFSVACNNGEFNISGDCFAEAWVKKENGGAVMFLGSTISQPWDPPMRGQDYFNDLIIGGYDYDAHSGQSGLNTAEGRSFIGSIVVNGLDLMLNESSTSDDIKTVQTWTTFGDPAMQIRTKQPEPLSLSNETVHTGEAYNTTVTSNGNPVSDAMVTLSQNGAYFTGLTDANGDVSIEHTLAAGTALLVVTAFNRETIYKDITVSSADGPWISVESFTEDDGTTGNANGTTEHGETVRLDVTAVNSGNEAAQAVQAKLRTSDIYLSITDSTHSYGDMAVDQSVAGNDAFEYIAADSVADQHTAVCTVYFTDASSGSWTSDISITINAPHLTTDTPSIDDSATGNNDGKLDEGETADYLIPTGNNGHAPAGDVSASLVSSSSYVTVQASPLDLGTIAANDTVNAVFTLTASNDTPAGTSVDLYYTVTSGAYVHKDTFQVTIGLLPTVLMHDGTETMDDCMFYDTGGADGQYSTNEKLTLTFYPSQRSVIKVIFKSFTLSDLDKLYIYDGTDDSAPQVAGSPFSTTNSPGEVVATNAEGALTFYFESNQIYNEAGWEAEVMTTAVADVENKSAGGIHSFHLSNNYPNPFGNAVQGSPATLIQYQLPQQSVVSLTIYNALGQQVKTLVTARQAAGTHSIRFDGRGLASGIYYYRLQAGAQIQIKKMILLH